MGSSPLTRGKPSPTRKTETSTRLIPAHAGKTFRHVSAIHEWRAHPRSRGENATRLRSCVRRSGSSPLTRGKRGLRCFRCLRGRLIPAHAGKTPGVQDIKNARAAHPRSRGENVIGVCLSSAIHGSSPLTRGKRPPRTGATRLTRLIPAHAGKTPTLTALTVTARAHPRSRGENGRGVGGGVERGGSSPLTRGKHGSSRPLR